MSLPSFLLKTMEKLVEKHVRESALKEYALHGNQYA
jgi:hypothetical protein